MALFVKRNNEGGASKFYQTSHSKTILVIGLGNVGKKYEGTRHNVGFSAIDSFAEKTRFPNWIVKKDLRVSITKHVIGDTHVILAKPSTYMNESGQAVFAVQNYFKIANSSTLVIHDDLDVDFGSIKIKKGGGSAGNNGIKSIIQHAGEDFMRIRIGVKNELLQKIDSADFVLAKFSGEEKEKLPKIAKEISSILSEYTASPNLPNETRKIL